MTAGNYISAAALLVSLVMMIASVANMKKSQARESNSDKKTDETQIREEAAKQTSIMIALDNIKGMLTDIKEEVSTVRADTRDNHDKLIILEQSCKSEHKRLDGHEERLKSIEEELRTHAESRRE